MTALTKVGVGVAPPPSPRAEAVEWRAAWPLVLAACAGVSWTSLIFSTIGLFIIPLQTEFGWSRSMATSGLAIVATLSVLLSPVIGMQIDRLGPRRIGLAGLGVFAAAIAALGLAGSSKPLWWGLWAAVALGAVLVKPTVWTAAVISRFTAARGVAIAVTLSGTSLTGIVAPLVAGGLIHAFDWRLGFAGLALVWLIVTLPPIVLFFFGAADRAGHDGVQTLRSDRQAADGMAIGRAVRSATFVKLATASTLVIFCLIAATVHAVPFLISRGISPGLATTCASIFGAASLIGRLVSGYCLDRGDPRLFGAGAFAAPAAGFAILATMATTPLTAVVAAILIGIGSGAEIQVAAFLTARCFGLRNYGTLFGIIAGLIAFAGGLGPSVVGAVYDHSHTYAGAVIAAIPLVLVAAILIASLGRVPPREQLEPAR